MLRAEEVNDRSDSILYAGRQNCRLNQDPQLALAQIIIPVDQHSDDARRIWNSTIMIKVVAKLSRKQHA